MANSKGLIQVYTGPGKGKTTAALGLIVRALGQGQTVLLVRLLKPTEPASGELLFFADQPRLRLINAGLGGLGSKVPPARLRQSIRDALAAAIEAWQEHPIDLLVIDEINNALHRDLLDMEEFWTFLDRRPSGTEVVLTGRNAPDALLERADLVTEMLCLRHPRQAGVAARPGIEY